MSDFLDELASGVKEAEKIAPALSGFSTLIPGVGPWITAASALLTLVGNAISTVQQNEGKSLPDAITAVASHLTPGQPNSLALSENPNIRSE